MVEALPWGERNRILDMSPDEQRSDATFLALEKLWAGRTDRMFSCNPCQNDLSSEAADYGIAVSMIDSDELLSIVEEIIKLRRERKPDFIGQYRAQFTNF